MEDNVEIQILLEACLDGHQLVFATTVKEAARLLESHMYDMAILDLGLPDGDGLEILTFLYGRRQEHEIPVIVLSGKSDTSSKVLAFSVGAEDFVSKPFDPAELRARVVAKLKRYERLNDSSEWLRIGDLNLSVPMQKVLLKTKDGKEQAIELTSLEFKLLHTLLRAPERVFTRDYLLDRVWGNQMSVVDRTVDTHISHLRKKLGESQIEIETVVGSGYRLLAKVKRDTSR